MHYPISRNINEQSNTSTPIIGSTKSFLHLTIRVYGLYGEFFYKRVIKGLHNTKSLITEINKAIFDLQGKT
jgi:hypothetical protein